MKKTLLFVLFFLFTFTLIEAKERDKKLSNPKIGLLFVYQDGTAKLRVKNTGDEVLNNITITALSFDFNFSENIEISTLAVGEESPIISVGISFFSSDCEVEMEAIVYATSENSVEISDISADPGSYDNPDYQSFL